MRRSLLNILVLLPTILSVAVSCTLIEVNLGPRQAPLAEKTISGSGTDKVLMVDLSGVMLPGQARPTAAPWSGSEDMVARLAEELGQARRDERIKALLVRIDSPGGAVTTADLAHHLLRRFREETKLPVVACLMSVAASGGYYAALAADRIYALPTTTTGSIGVIALKLNLAGIMGRYGVEAETVKSAPLKDIWSPFRPATSEERRIMQGIIDDMFGRFKSVLLAGRPKMTPDQVNAATDARIFTATQALNLGLIDAIGYPEEAFQEARKLAGLTEAQLVVYHRPGAYRSNIYAGDGLESGLLDPGRWLHLAGSPQFMYLWLPGVN